MTLLLETPRLILRRFVPADAASFAAYRSDPEIARYQSWDTPYTLEQALRFMTAMDSAEPGQPGHWFQVALQLKSDPLLIGDCAFQILAEDSRQAEIGFTLAGPYHGQGYAAEAVRRLLGYLFTGFNLHRVRANCDVENTASARLMERVGMRREAHFIESLWFKGRWSSEYWYAILRDEWEKGAGR
jgi:RimJ/RimL family protein N-acetyltransferase